VVRHERPSHLDNPQTQANRRQATEAVARFTAAHPERARRMHDLGRDFREIYRDRLRERREVCTRYYHEESYRYFYSSFFEVGFYGGYYYPVRPCVEIDTYFTYPVVEWLYVDTPEVDTYQDYYGEDSYERYPVEPFEFARVFYPTDTLRDLAVEVSGMMDYQQAAFRRAITLFAGKLQDQLSDNLSASFELSDNDVVITHYESYQGKAIELEGFVDRGDLHASFKALLDLEGPDQTLVLVPMGPELSPDEVELLKTINDRIVALGGDPFTAQEEPETATPDDN
jgi:hypothetical protein